MCVENIKKIAIVLGIFLLQLNCLMANAVEEVSNNDTPKFTTGITFDEILEKARNHSYDLKIADFNILISKQEIRGARSEYFPKLHLSAGTEYTKNFRDTKDSTVMSIGDAFINPYTRYQAVLGITLSYNLFDFGVRRGQLNIAKEDEALRILEEQQKLQDLNLTLVDTYSKIILTKKQIEYYKKILAIQENNLEYYTRLFNAKEVSRTELNDATVKVSETKRKIGELKGILAESLNWLSFYTGDNYDIENLKVSEIKKPTFDVSAFNDYTKSIIWQINEKKIKKKEFELKVAKRTNYPKVNAYSRYYLYGSDKSNYGESFGNIRPSNFTVGGSINMLAFDGMKNRANIEKVNLELQQLQVERDKSIAEFMTKLATMRTNLMYLNKQLNENKDIVKELTDKEKSMRRLSAKKIISPIEDNNTKVELLEQQIEYEKNRITAIAITKGIQILTEEYKNDAKSAK